MNPTQIATSAGPLVAFFAGLLAGRGAFGIDAAGWTTILGGFVGFGAAVWSVFTTRKSAITATVANLPEVTEVKVNTTLPEGKALVDATPPNVTPA